MRLSLFISILFTAVFVSCATASNKIAVIEKPENIKKYGENAPRIWSELTQAEMETVIKAKTATDNETLLVLALLMTGSTRERPEIDAALSVYRNFTAICDKELNSIADAKEKGRKLHELFFRQFIGTFKKNGTGVAGLLLKKEFDTNTASLLFAVAAEKYGFSPKISVTEEDSTKITSSKTGLTVNVFSGKSYLELKHKDLFSSVIVLPFIEKGYDPYINMDFFENLQKSGLAGFEDAAVEFKEYYRKKPFSLQEALLLQYKADNGDSFETEISPFNRRVEMAAVLTDSCDVLMDRVWAWRNIHAFILERKKSGELLSFVDTISPELDRTGRLCGDDSRFAQSAWDLFLFSAFEYGNAVNGAGMKTAVRNAYSFLSTTSKDYDKKRMLLAGSIHYYMNQVIKNDVIEEQLEHAVSVIDAIPENRTRMEVGSSFYYQAGEHYFKKKDHWRAGQFYAECAFIDGNPYKKICISKGADELYQYAVDSIEKNICATASDAVEKCFEKIQDKPSCSKIKDTYDNACK
ncbi:MAG TPA: hypothetical protein P5044_07605 [bacterium]|nr:hypothetical protein [bacterium]